MNIDEFQASLARGEPDDPCAPLLQALWWDAKGDWHRAHEIAQDVETAMGSLVHAYLHRKEGDVGNAQYWYRRANRPLFQRSLEQEWEAIVTELIDET